MFVWTYGYIFVLKGSYYLKKYSSWQNTNRIKEKVRELQSLSLKQTTGHRIVVESPSWSLTKKNIRSNKKNTKIPLKWPETNYWSCSVKRSSRLSTDGTAVEIQHCIWLGTKPCLHGQGSANDTKSNFDSYLYWQVPDTYH